jgi:acyl carrier protein
MTDDPIATRGDMDTLDRIRQHIIETAWVPDDLTLTDDLSLIDSGVVDSTGMMDVILFVETEFGIRVADQDITPQNFETIDRIATYVDQKVAGRSA